MKVKLLELLEKTGKELISGTFDQFIKLSGGISIAMYIHPTNLYIHTYLYITATAASTSLQLIHYCAENAHILPKSRNG